MGKAMSGISSQAANLPKIAAISPSLSLPKLQGNGTAGRAHHGQVGHQGQHGHHPQTTVANTSYAEAAGASVEAVNQGNWRMIWHKEAK